MSRIIITTDDQNLSFTNMPDIYSGDVNYDEVEVVFDDTWNSMSRTVVFWTKETIENPTGVLLGSDNIAKIPHELISECCTLYIGVYGIIDDSVVKTSQILKYAINEGCLLNTKEPESIKYEYWQQVLSVLGAVQQDVSNINTEIDLLKAYDLKNTENINQIKSDVLTIKTKLDTIEIADIEELKTYLGII